MTRPYVLLIEDEPDLCDEIRGYLSRHQNVVRGCSTITEARQALGERRPDVVISDIGLPDGNGASFCLEQAGKYPKTKWLLISGDPSLARQNRQLKRDPNAPPFSVLDKPVPLRALADFVRLAMMQGDGTASGSASSRSSSL